MKENIKITEDQYILIATLCAHRKADLLEINLKRKLTEGEEHHWYQVCDLEDTATHAMRKFWVPAEDMPSLQLVRDGKNYD